MSAFLYTLGLHTGYTTDEVLEELCRLLGVPQIEEVGNYWPALEIQMVDSIHPCSREIFTETLGTVPTTVINYYLDIKTDLEQGDRAHIVMAVSAVKLVCDMNALAFMMYERDKIIMRRTNGLLYLYEQTGRWRDPEIVAQLPEPWILTDDIDAGIPEGAIPFR